MEHKTKTGRPRKHDDATLYESALYKLLLEKLPSEYIKFGRLDTESIRVATQNARYTIYRWLNEQKLSPKASKALQKLSRETADAGKKGLLTREDLLPFVDC